MSIIKVIDVRTVAPLVKDWEETLIWSCLQGCMGQASTVDSPVPESVQILVGAFCFFAGKPTIELVKHKPDGYSDFIIMAPQTMEWGILIEEVYGKRATKHTRYAIKKEPYIFDKERLSHYVKQLSPEFTLTMIDERLYHQIRQYPWACDLCCNFATYDEYREHGIGVVALKNGEIVSGASSYSYYQGGIEIEIDTREDFRRRGLALSCGAKLILECIKTGLYPSWDAQNLGSVALAEKLGYHYDQDYVAYEVYPY